MLKGNTSSIESLFLSSFSSCAMSWFRNRRYATEDTVVIVNRTYLFFLPPPNNRKRLYWERRSWSWTMSCPHPKAPPGVRSLHSLLYLWNAPFLLIHADSLMAIRSGRNVRQRRLHSKEADAPDGSAARGDPGCPQVRLGVRRDG